MIKIICFRFGKRIQFRSIVKQAREYTVAVLIVDNREAYAVERANRLKIPSFVVEPSHFLQKAPMKRKSSKYWNHLPLPDRACRLYADLRCGPA